MIPLVAAIPTIASTVSSVLNRILPAEKMTEAESAQVELALLKADWEPVAAQLAVNAEEAKSESRFVAGWQLRPAPPHPRHGDPDAGPDGDAGARWAADLREVPGRQQQALMPVVRRWHARRVSVAARGEVPPNCHRGPRRYRSDLPKPSTLQVEPMGVEPTTSRVRF